jgi:hypothetical protein
MRLFCDWSQVLELRTRNTAPRPARTSLAYNRTRLDPHIRYGQRQRSHPHTESRYCRNGWLTLATSTRPTVLNQLRHRPVNTTSTSMEPKVFKATASKVPMSSEICRSPISRFKITDAEKAHFSSLFSRSEAAIKESLSGNT